MVLGVVLGLGLSGVASCNLASRPPAAKPSESMANGPRSPEPVRYETRTFPAAIAHVISVPANGAWQIRAAVAPTVETLDRWIQQTPGSIAAINGGFFDPDNQKTTAFVTHQGKLVADPRTNEQLVNNPALTPYLRQIFDRSEWRRYQCGATVRDAIVLHSTAIPAGCDLLEAIGGGPQLLPKLTIEPEGFWLQTAGQVIRDPIGVYRRNARSAIGLAADGRVWLVMVQQRSSQGGMTLPELAQFLQSLGADRALNLDGGTSSAIYANGHLIYGKRDESDRPQGRPVKSVLLVQPR